MRAGDVTVRVPAWEEEGVLPGGDLFLLAGLLDRVRRDYPGRRVVLAPQPRRATAKLALLAELCDPGPAGPLDAATATVVTLDAALLADLPDGVERVLYRQPFVEPDTLPGSGIDVRDLRLDLAARVPLRPAGARRGVPVPLGAADSLRRLAMGLFATVVAGARVLVDRTGPGGWRQDLALAVTSGLTVADAVDPGVTTVVLVDDGDALGPVLDQSTAAVDVRVFHSGATGDDVRRLRAGGFRVFALDDDTTSWRELPDGPLDVPVTVYAVRNPGTRTVSCYLHDGGLMGGAQRSHLELVDSLIRQGCMVHSIVPQAGSGLAGALRALGCALTIVPRLQPWMVHPDDLDRSANEPATTTTLLSASDPLPALHALRPDLVLTQSAVVQHAAIAAAVLGIPHVWYLREFGDLDHGLLMPGPAPVVGELIAALSSRVVTNSAAVREHFFPGRPDRATVLHPAPRVEPGPGRKDPRLPVADGVLTVGVVASLQDGKGQGTLFRAVAQLRDRGVPVAVECLGDDRGSEAVRLRALVDELGIADAVTFHGVVLDRGRIYPAVDVVVVASRHEAFGRIPFEAAAYRVPVVFADVAGPAEYLQDRVNALGFEPGDAAGLAAALGDLAADPALRERLADAAETLIGPARQQVFDAALTALVGSVPPG